ncbi:palmitoyltransferase ZDHHC14 [Trichuris trichiura]|uniref:Palmitoyltransferase n=1 Tax=Trichuris trichiura TaxID=36087 RepID=A0A077Z7X7_TRITR|nr:palmitoyltransferase ZDHHC14 [Trichuris trichiura]
MAVESLKRKRVWQVHQGQNKFFCDGRVVTSNSLSTLPVTIMLILVTMTFFYIFDVPYFCKKFSCAIAAVACCLTAVCAISLYLSAFADPGILPRANSAQCEELNRFLSASGIYVPKKGVLVAPPFTAIEDGQMVLIKFCSTCKIYRPAKCSHCSVCDNCVERFDHHCPWLGNCIGRRNYASFFLFISCLSMLIVFVLTCEVVRIIDECDSYGKFVAQNPFSTIVLFVTLVTSLPVVSLTAYHAYLVCVSASTCTDLKQLIDPNPLHAPVYLRLDLTWKRCWKNCALVFCESLPPGIDFRAYVQEEKNTNIELAR